MKAVSNMYKEKPADAMDHSVTYICTFVFIIILLLLLLTLHSHFHIKQKTKAKKPHFYEGQSI